MKKAILSLSILISLSATAQKINSCNYKDVDTLLKYKNAEIIIYKKNNRQVSDTVYFSKMKCIINIDIVDFMIIDEDKVLRKPKTHKK